MKLTFLSRLFDAGRALSGLGLIAVAGYALLFGIQPARATYRAISVLKAPAAPLTLTHNVVTIIPGTYCSVVVRNPTANPVYYGGPSGAGVVVNTAGALAVCTDTAACESDMLSVNVMTGGIALLSTIDTTVRYETGEGCQP